MPLNRTFPNDRRFRVTFDSHIPVYVYIDNLGGWNVDTRYLTAELRGWLDEQFERLFNLHFPRLYVYHVLQAQHEFYAMHLLHVTLTKDTKNPSLVLTYYDKTASLAIPGRMSHGTMTDCDAILDDFNGNYPSPSF
jgi:hypothetical protein